jgi:PRTRC genetic system protein C
MSAAIITLDRVFRFSGMDLPDPDPTMEPEAVLKHYSRQFPRLVGAKVIAPVQEADTYVYEFRQNEYGAKG